MNKLMSGEVEIVDVCDKVMEMVLRSAYNGSYLHKAK